MSTKAPHMPVWIADIETDRFCRGLTDAQFGRYMRLLFRQWIEGDIPAELPDIIRDARIDADCNGELQTLLDAKFPPAEGGDGERQNLVCKAIRDEVHRKIQTNRDNGKLGGRPRNPTDNQTVKRTQSESKPNGSIRVSDSESNSESDSSLPDKGECEGGRRMKRPTLTECEQHATDTGMPASEGAKFFHYQESKGWLVGKAPMQKWKSAMATWKQNHAEGIFSNSRDGPAETPEQRSEQAKADARRINQLYLQDQEEERQHGRA